MANPRDTSAPAPTAPGPKVVEALANSMIARFANRALVKAEAALRREYAHEGRVPTPDEALELELVSSLGAQLVTATTVPTVNGGDK